MKQRKEWSDIFGDQVSAVDVLEAAPDTVNMVALAEWLRDEARALHTHDDAELKNVDWYYITRNLVEAAQALCTKSGDPPCMSCASGIHTASSPGGPPDGGPQEYEDMACEVLLDTERVAREGYCWLWKFAKRGGQQREDGVVFMAGTIPI
jgi:hypothetical protein